jgi:type I restriction enzyme R subunit
LDDNPHAKAYFGAIRLLLGDQACDAMDEAVAQAKLIEHAWSPSTDTVVRDAVAEHSLNPQNIEAAIRKGLLPMLFGRAGPGERARRWSSR